MKDKLQYLTITEVAEGLKAGEFTSVEVTKACLEHIKRLDIDVKSFIRLDEEVALAQAGASDKRRRDGQTRGILDGVPYNIKDVFATKDSPTTAASYMLDEWWAPYNATVYSKLKEAGAVLLGKTNTDEFTMGGSTETSYYGVTANPWDLKRVSGGSSGGPAASMAMDFGIFSIGTDTGGSIRQPAAYCGVTGLRPTYGRVSRFGELAMASSLDQTGPVCKNALDCAIVLGVLAGQDPLDATSSDVEVVDYAGVIASKAKQSEIVTDSASPRNDKKPLSGLKVGLPVQYFGAGVDGENEARVRDAVKVLENLGAKIIDLDLPMVKYALAVYYVICPAEVSSNMARYDGIHFGYSIERSEKNDGKKLPDLYEVYARSRAEGFGNEVKRRIMLGAHVLSSGYYDAYYKKAEAVRAVVAREFAKAFEDVDVIAGPVAPGCAFKIGEKINDQLAMYMEDVLTVPLNIAGIPGMSVPCGFVGGKKGDDIGLEGVGMPVGLQLMSARFKEETILKVAHAYQSVTDWHLRKPDINIK